VVLGLPDGRATLDVRRLVLRNVRAFFAAASGTRDGVTDFSIALGLLAATPAAAALVTHRLPLDEVGNAFLTAARPDRGSIRVVVSPYLPNV
jgi:threonine dehydrogenase-like Zn-dependent dehydrogenase